MTGGKGKRISVPATKVESSKKKKTPKAIIIGKKKKTTPVTAITSTKRSLPIVLSLNNLPKELVLCISSFCNFDGVEALSFLCQSLNKIIRIHSLGLPTIARKGSEITTRDGFTVLKDEVRAFLHNRIKNNSKKKSSAAMENITISTTTTSILNNDWRLTLVEAKTSRAFILRYAMDKKMIHAKEIADNENKPDDSPYWKDCMTIDILFSSLEEKELTFDEQQQLTNFINGLFPNKLLGIIDIIRDSGIDDDEVDIDIEIDALDSATQRKLQRYVASCFPRSKEIKLTYEEQQQFFQLLI